MVLWLSGPKVKVVGRWVELRIGGVNCGIIVGVGGSFEGSRSDYCWVLSHFRVTRLDAC